MKKLLIVLLLTVFTIGISWWFFGHPHYQEDRPFFVKMPVAKIAQSCEVQFQGVRVGHVDSISEDDSEMTVRILVSKTFPLSNYMACATNRHENEISSLVLIVLPRPQDKLVFLEANQEIPLASVQ
ncbi:MAG: hypothetical protein J0M17_09475 [Planctomycetes bacterium]|nr:hypothetical protein [Planctomycetota bacterium]